MDAFKTLSELNNGFKRVSSQSLFSHWFFSHPLFISVSLGMSITDLETLAAIGNYRYILVAGM